MARRKEAPLWKPDATLCDPHQGYRVFTHNKDFSQTVGEVTFSNGQALLSALPADADPEDIEDRMATLSFFQNAPQSAIPQKTWDDDRNTMVVNGYKYEATYRVEPVSELVATDTARDRARKAREAAAAEA